MPALHWRGGSAFRRVKSYVAERLWLLKLTCLSLFYNDFWWWGAILETLIEPFIWVIERFVRYLGPSFVTLIVWMTTCVSVAFYACLLTHAWAEESAAWTCGHLIVGHYFLYCTVFYYFRAAFTDPGHPPEEIPETVGICKKCIAPKPPRAHHCSVCNKCVLKMDHHCPWLNNCIGHGNQRYFLLFCTYMWAGTTYASYAAYPLFKQHLYDEQESSPGGIFYPFYMINRAIQDYKARSAVDEDGGAQEDAMQDAVQDAVQDADYSSDMHVDEDPPPLPLHTIIVYLFLLCSAVSVALFLLLAWHCRLVLRGETSIEYHINHKQRQRMRKKGLVYKNPYDFGLVKNLEMILGISNKPGWRYLRYVVLPSGHEPEEDGLQWQTNRYPVDRGLLLI